MELTQSNVTKHAIEAQRIYRYYSKLSTKYARRHQALMLAISLLTVGAVVLIGMGAPLGFVSLAAAGAAIMSAVSPILDYSRRAAVAASVAHLCMDLTDDWEQVWLMSKEPTGYRLTAHNRLDDEYTTLVRRLTRATAPAALQHGFDDEKLNKEANAEAKRDWELTHV